MIALVVLVGIELALGIDNIVLVTSQVAKLTDKRLRDRARLIGLGAAGGMRILLVLSVSWILKLEHPVISPFGKLLSGRDLIMLGGGLYLLYHSVKETVEKVNGLKHGHATPARATPGAFYRVIASIMMMDLVFSIDSVMTAVGLVESLSVMIAAIVLSVVAMMWFSGTVERFINQNPSLQILALSFLILISVLLLADGWGQHIPKGYVYFAMGYAFLVDLLQMRAAKRNGA